MKYNYLIYVSVICFIVSCKKDEAFINNFVKNNNIHIVNLSEKAIPSKLVLNELDLKT